jgi:predicted dehydrogenase
VSARRDLGGGVVLELSHELDTARWLMGDVRNVGAVMGHLSDLEIDVEDTAEILLEFRNGAVGSVHLDMVQRTPRRTYRIIGTEGTVVCDVISNRVSMFSVSGNEWSDLYSCDNMDRNQLYVEELQRFFSCIHGNSAPLISGDEGKRVLEIALAVKKSAVEKRLIPV